jgi:hypothetical protein
MSYSLTVNGHNDTTGEDESRAFEEEVAAKAREFVASLDGVTLATGSFGTLGAVDLRADTTAA